METLPTSKRNYSKHLLSKPTPLSGDGNPEEKVKFKKSLQKSFQTNSPQRGWKRIAFAVIVFIFFHLSKPTPLSGDGNVRRCFLVFFQEVLSKPTPLSGDGN